MSINIYIYVYMWNTHMYNIFTKYKIQKYM